MYIERRFQFVNEKHLINEAIEFVRALHSLERKNVCRENACQLMMKNFCVRQHVGEDDGLVYEMFFINELKPTLNVQSDSIRAKAFN